jgi:hypothetical protein
MEYDPDHTPDPTEWLALDESERLALIVVYHEEAEVVLPNPVVHAAIHATVENQVALGEELPVRATLERLIAEGLDRHEAIHAIGSVLAEYIYDLSRQQPTDSHEVYFRKLESLTAQRWRESV